jgi:hypothetical protein
VAGTMHAVGACRSTCEVVTPAAPCKYGPRGSAAQLRVQGAQTSQLGIELGIWEVLSAELDIWAVAHIRDGDLGRAHSWCHLPAGRIPSSMVADVLRAVGYYPSEEEVAVLQCHIQYMHGVQAEDSEQEATVDLDQLITLYINHRPVTGVTKEEIHAAFSTISGTAEGTGCCAVVGTAEPHGPRIQLT